MPVSIWRGYILYVAILSINVAMANIWLMAYQCEKRRPSKPAENTNDSSMKAK
jgi:hypothetical protein